MGNCAGQLKRSRKSHKLKRKRNIDESGENLAKRNGAFTKHTSPKCVKQVNLSNIDFPVSTDANPLHENSPPIKPSLIVEDNESGFYDDSERVKTIRKTSYSECIDVYNDDADSSESWNDLKHKTLSETSFSICLKEHMSEILNGDLWYESEVFNKNLEYANGAFGFNGNECDKSVHLFANYRPFLEPKNASLMRNILNNASVIKILSLQSIIPNKYRFADLTSDIEFSLIVSGICIQRCTNGFDKGSFWIRCGGDLRAVFKLNDVEKENVYERNCFNNNARHEVKASLVQNELNHFLAANFVSEVIQNFFSQNDSEVKFVLNLKNENDAEMPSSDIVIYNISLDDSKSLCQASIRSNGMRFAFHIPDWPENFCAEYFSRKRIWPSKEIIDCIRTNGALLSLRKAKDKDYEWSFSFLLAESLLVQALTNKQITLYVNVKYFISDCNAQIPDFILKHAFFKFCEVYKLHVKDNILALTKSFFSYLVTSLRNGELLHYFNSSRNILLYMNPLRRIELTKTVETILTYISSLSNVEVRKNANNQLLLYDKLDYLVEFHKTLRDQVLNRTVHCVNVNTIRSINDILKTRTDLALRIQINEDELYETLERSASIVQSYINQMRSKQIPVLYHCLWSSYIHFVYPFISKVWTTTFL